MRICFSFVSTGLANNGGTRTILRCAETLAELGHEVFLWGTRGRYSWHDPKGVKFVWPTCPPVDAMIATGYGSYKSVASSNAPVRANYVRVPEFWSASEDKLLQSYRAIPHMFVNSEWQVGYMQERGITALLQYPGLDWQWFKNYGGLRDGVGALEHPHKRKRSVDCHAVEQLLGMTWKYLNRDIKKPDSIKLCRWYNDLQVWFAPTELEGLHNPPTEAALSGCALVCTDHPRSGMADYAVHNETALVYSARNLKQAAEYVRQLLNDEPLRERLNKGLVSLLADKMGTRKQQMTLFAQRLEELRCA